MEHELTTEEWKAQKKEKKAAMAQRQAIPYRGKVNLASTLAYEFDSEMAKMGHTTHVSVGGLDSITLMIFLESLHIHTEAISISMLEDRSIQEVHKALGVTRLNPTKSKHSVIQDVGFPVISKRIAGKIDLLQHPTEDNKTVRHAIITGECGAQGHFAKNSRMKLPQKWLELFGGTENENEGVHYKVAPFKVSNKCCYYLKEKPADDWAKAHDSYPYLGMMASEGGQREEAITEHGCNYYGKTVMRSCPFGSFLRNDILQLALDMDKWYHEHIDVFERKFHEQPYGKHPDGSPREYVPLDTIIPSIYGEIRRKPNGDLYTTKAQRTGCSMCGFGVHMEKRPHRFDLKRKENPKEWEYLMYKMVKDPVTGEQYGWGKVLDYIGVKWEDYPETQMTIYDWLPDDQLYEE